MHIKIKLLLKEALKTPLLLLAVISNFYSLLLNLIKPGIGYFLQDSFTNKNQSRTQKISHICQNGSLFEGSIYTPNNTCRIRANNFSTKEPETLAWIDQYGGDGALFDVGANIGLYSIYYASTKKSAVVAFEPSFFNVAELAKNIAINKLTGLIKIVTNPLTNFNQFAEFSLSSIDIGGSQSAFGVDYGFNGEAIEKFLTYQTLGFTLDELFHIGALKDYPTLIKIDVDGIEHLILSGAVNTLKNPICRSVLIEVLDAFTEQASVVKEIMENAGFTLKAKMHSDMLNADDSYNQIWVKG